MDGERLDIDPIGYYNYGEKKILVKTVMYKPILDNTILDEIDLDKTIIDKFIQYRQSRKFYAIQL